MLVIDGLGRPSYREFMRLFLRMSFRFVVFGTLLVLGLRSRAATAEPPL